MLGRTLALYFARRFAAMVIAIFLFFFLLIATITYLEFFMRSVRDAELEPLKVLLIALFRAPSICEDVLPFTVLFGSIAAFIVANRRLEVVIARAAGVSAWQFLVPACIVGLLIGIAFTTVYNPVSTTLRGWGDRLEADLLSLGSATDRGGPLWVRQGGGGRESILGALHSYNDGLELARVTVFEFAPDGSFTKRIDADKAQYTPGEWIVGNATSTAPGEDPEFVEIYHLPTTLSTEQVRENFNSLSSISFWELPWLIESASRAGLPTSRYSLRYNSLIARPVLLLAMVLIAAIVSLRFSRSREVGRMILAGIAVGFVLYVITKIASDLGSGGVVPPPLAAWLPAIVTILMGTTLLLHLEDG